MHAQTRARIAYSGRDLYFSCGVQALTTSKTTCVLAFARTRVFADSRVSIKCTCTRTVRASIKCTYTHCQCGVRSNRASGGADDLIKCTWTCTHLNILGRLIKSGASDQ